jgi:GNAT superfamily N-acetyltransferase
VPDPEERHAHSGGLSAADVSVRPAAPADASSLVGVTLAAWDTWWVPRLSTDPDGPALAPLDAASVLEGWRETLGEPPSPRHRVLVALTGSEPAGYAVLTPSPDADADEGTADLADLVVAPGHTRRGHASRLLAAAVELLRDLGFATLTSWCDTEDDARARFLGSAGFAPDGAMRTLGDGPGGGVLRQVRYTASIAPTT